MILSPLAHYGYIILRTGACSFGQYPVSFFFGHEIRVNIFDRFSIVHVPCGKIVLRIE